MVCRECRAPGKECFNHTFNAPCCQVLTARIARLRAKTIYEDTLTLCTLPKLPAQLSFTSQLASLRFLQANLDHTRAATEHFVSYMEATNIDFVVVCNPYVRGGTVPGIPPRWFKFHHAQTPRCMVVSRNVSLDLFPIHVSPFVIALTLNAPNLSILFIGVYAAPSVALDHILSSVGSLLDSNNADNVVIAGDFNARNPLGGG